MLDILLTIIQFGILFYLFFKVKTILIMLEKQQMENNQILVILKKLKEQIETKN